MRSHFARRPKAAAASPELVAPGVETARTKFVWIADWEMQCCGEPFFLGERVDWPASQLTDTSWYADLGFEQVPFWIYSAHTDDEPRLCGTVEEIQAVFCRFRVRRRTATMISGTGILEPRTRAARNEPHDEWGGPKSWIGYLVRLNAELGE